MSYYNTPVILHVLQSGRTIRTITPKTSLENFMISELEPGDYSFRVIIDENSNGHWDTGDKAEYLQPEKVDVYSTPTKVRANWEVEVTLIPNK